MGPHELVALDDERLGLGELLPPEQDLAAPRAPAEALVEVAVPGVLSRGIHSSYSSAAWSSRPAMKYISINRRELYTIVPVGFREQPLLLA